MTVRGELEAGTKAAVEPGSNHAEGSLVDAGESVDAADDFLIEIEDLLGSFAVCHDGNVDVEDVAGVHAGTDALKSDERCDEYAGAGAEGEGGANLADKKDALAAADARCY